MALRFRRRDSRRDRGAPIRWAIDALAILGVLWVIGLFWYAHEIRSLTPGRDTPQDTANANTAKADAVVVLTGSTDRLTQGFELLAGGRGDRLFISGVYRGVDVQQILRALRRSPNEVHNEIVLGYGADDTVGNAQETAVWMAKEGLTSLILVTSNFHMPRALLEFHAAMPQVTIIPHPTASQSFRIDDWWWWPGTLRLIASEWTKYIAAKTTLMLDMRFPRRPPVSPAPMDIFPLPEPSAAPTTQPSADPSPPPVPPADTAPDSGNPAPPAAPAPDTQRAAPEFGDVPAALPESAPQAPDSDSDEPDETPPPDDPSAPPDPPAGSGEQPQ
jgi:uncharacterized SAM-binding protein YcdF (DUF218 family)